MAKPWVEQPVDAVARLLQQVREAFPNTDSMVRVNPWAAVGVDVCMGLAAGYLLSRRF